MPPPRKGVAPPSFFAVQPTRASAILRAGHASGRGANVERDDGSTTMQDEDGGPLRATSGRSPRAGGGRGRKAQIDESEARRRLAASKKLYYRIGEVSELTGVKAHVLRYWETEFRWMTPPKSRSKQRLYRKRDIEFVWLLKRLLWDQRYTIAGARQRIQDLGLEEALHRCAEGTSLDDALGARSLAADDPFPTGAEFETRPVPAAAQAGEFATPPTEHPVSPDGVDWPGLRGALESMQAELLALRGALQQGL